MGWRRPCFSLNGLFLDLVALTPRFVACRWLDWGGIVARYSLDYSLTLSLVIPCYTNT